MDRADRTGDAGLAARGLAKFRLAFEVTPPGDPDYDVAVYNLAHALIARFEFIGDHGALNEAIALLSQDLRRRSRTKDQEARCHSLLGRGLHLKAERSGDIATMNLAVKAHRRALTLTGRSLPAYSDRLYELGEALAAQFSLTGDLRSLEGAVRFHGAAVRRSAPAEQGYAARLSGLGKALIRQAVTAGDPGILRDAVQVTRQALEAVSKKDAHLGKYKSYLGIALLREYEATGLRDALDESIECLREALALTPASHADQVPRLTGLAAALMVLYERTSDQAVLDEVTATYRLAVRAASGYPEHYVHSLYGLATARLQQAEHAGGLVVFDEVIGLLREVADLTPDGHPNRPHRLSALAAATFQRFREDPYNLEPLDGAIAILREALRLAPEGHPERPRILSNLGSLLDSRYERDGDPGTAHEAVTVHRECLAATPLGHSERGMRLSNQVISLTHQSALTGQDNGLQDAVLECQRELSATPPGDSRNPQTLLALGSAHAQRFALTGNRDALDAGLAACREAFDDRTASTRIRIEAGRDGGRLAASAGLPGDARALFAGAVRLMDEATWARPAYADRERLLGQLTGLPADAAAMAIEAGHLEEAVELLEQGRGVLLTRHLEAQARYRTLRDKAPELAEQLTWILRALDPSPPVIPADDPSFTARPSRSRTELARDRDAITGQIRARPDLADLLAAPGFTQLLRAAACGPVIILNVSKYRCDALILTEDGVRLVPLPQLDADAVGTLAREFLGAASASSRDLATALEWTWDTIVGPIFSALGLTSPVAHGDQASHIWWCPTGEAVFLPLHAAGHYPANDLPDTALHRAVSSFTPTLRSLIQLRDRHPGALLPAAGPLIVAMPQTPGANDLPEAKAEATELASRFGSSEYLSGVAATHSAVTEAMSRHPWAHFACHGIQDLDAPSCGRLALHDAPLTISQLMALRLDNPEFAFLSACETYRGGTRVPDEAITLASAMQFAGYKHVIATLWPIFDLTGPEIARRVYNRIVVPAHGYATIDASGVAAALRVAVAELIAESPGIPPLYWAAYIHTGP